jgi:hypothetical protein
MELNMTNYIYEVIENGYYEETESWQNAIDLFNHAGPLRNNKRARIEVYRLLDTGGRYFTTTLRTHTDIHEWSEKLIDNLQANRIERRLMKESLPKPMSWQFEEAAIREAQEDHWDTTSKWTEELLTEEETLENHKYLSNNVPCTRDEDGEIVPSPRAQVILDEITCLEESIEDEREALSAQLNKIYDEDGLYPCSENVCFCDDEACLEEDIIADHYTDWIKDNTDYVAPDFHGDFSGMSDEVKDSIINPKHYKIFSPEDYAKYPDGIEYMDLCDQALAHLSGVESHLVGQILKYTLRVGKKDAMEQDATKIEWYATRLVNTVKGK